MMAVRKIRLIALFVAFGLIAAACGEPEPLTVEDAEIELQELVDDIGTTRGSHLEREFVDVGQRL